MTHMYEVQITCIHTCNQMFILLCEQKRYLQYQYMLFKNASTGHFNRYAPPPQTKTNTVFRVRFDKNIYNNLTMYQ